MQYDTNDWTQLWYLLTNLGFRVIEMDQATGLVVIRVPE